MCYFGFLVFRIKRYFDIKISVRDVYLIYFRDNIIIDI